MLEGIAARIREAAVAALNDEAEQLAELARSKAPRRKEKRKDRPGGPLVDSIRAVEAVQDGEGNWTARVEATAPYAKFVEYPTARTAAQPFLRPALEESREAIVAGVTEAVQSAARSGGARSVKRKITLKLSARES